MNTDKAVALLEKFKSKKIKDVYDETGVSDALLALNPKFEYPDWDGRTVEEFLRKNKKGTIMDKNTRIAMAKSLLDLAKSIKAADVAEGAESEKLLKQNPQLNTIARKLSGLGLDTSDMLTAVLMAMKLKGAPAAEVNKAYSLLKPLLKKIV